MRSRFGEEIKFVVEADESLTALEVWTERIFAQDADDFRLPEEAWSWFKEVTREAYAKAGTKLIRKMILVKVIHTREVVRAGFDIVKDERKCVWNLEQVGAVCLLHDIARFDQAVLGSYSDSLTNFDHAREGAKMIREHKFINGEVDWESVAEAVEWHSAFSYEGENRYAKLARDADKLALMRSMPELLAVEIGGFKEEGVTKEALESYRKKEIVKRADMITKADLFLAWLAWEYDLNFEKTRKCFYDEGIKEWMVAELKGKYGVEI